LPIKGHINLTTGERHESQRHHDLTLITNDCKILDYGTRGYVRARASSDKELIP